MLSSIQMKKVRRIVRSVEQCIAGEGLYFVLKNQPYCERARDRIHSVHYTEIDREIQVFRSSGYSEQEIAELYDSIHDERKISGDYYRTISRELPRPVHVIVTIGEWTTMEPSKSVV